jgi:hypothetical protein
VETTAARQKSTEESRGREVGGTVSRRHSGQQRHRAAAAAHTRAEGNQLTSSVTAPSASIEHHMQSHRDHTQEWMSRAPHRSRASRPVPVAEAGAKQRSNVRLTAAAARRGGGERDREREGERGMAA